MTTAAAPATPATGNSSAPTPERIMQFAWGYAVPLIIESALEIGLFDALDKGAMSAEQLTERTGASLRGLQAIANALVSVGLLTKDKNGRYDLTPESAAFLVTHKPGFQGGIYRHVSKQLLPKWLNLPEIVRTGRPSAAVNGQDEGGAFFEKLVEDIFPMSYRAAKALGESLQLANAKEPVRVLDLASGSGVWGIGLAQLSPKVSVVAVDWPRVLEVTRRIATRYGVADRFSYVGGDLLSVEFGSGFNLATLGHILHSEGETRTRELLKKAAAALAPGGTIAIAEFVADDTRSGPTNAMIFAVNMLVNTEQGNTFTFPEISGWLQEAGFGKVRQLPAPAPSPLILAEKL